MPWRSAKVMVSNEETPPAQTELTIGHSADFVTDGLLMEWTGRVWLNPPYSNILPWVLKLAAHDNGILLVPAKSTDSIWGQLVLQTAEAILFFRGRLLFHYINGEKSKGAWGPSMLAAYGKRQRFGVNKNVAALLEVQENFQDGVIFQRPSASTQADWYVQRRGRCRAFHRAAKSRPCIDCGHSFPPECMDFDHVRGEKIMPVSRLSKDWRSLKLLLEEIEKCDVVCANCHRIRTTSRMKETELC